MEGFVLGDLGAGLGFRVVECRVQSLGVGWLEGSKLRVWRFRLQGLGLGFAWV